MKRSALIASALAVPLAVAGVATAGLTSTAPIPNKDKRVTLQAGATKAVPLGTVSTGTGYAWKWVTKPAAGIAKGYAPKAAPTRKGAAPGAPAKWSVRVLGLAEDQTTSGVVGLFGPGQTAPTRTVTLAITVTGDGR